ncbi:MAG TPA: hypothetical protein VF469_22620 [Kofleriaceae bacterium]
MRGPEPTGQPRITGRPERIFVSVDASTGRSTISFAPADAGSPFQRDGDADGAHAMRDAKAIVARYPGATIHGPHFHAARTGRARPRRRP